MVAWSVAREKTGFTSLRHARVRADEATIAKALVGTWREEHLFALKQAVELYDAYQARLEECDTELARVLTGLAVHDARKAAPAKPRRGGRPRRTAFDLREALYRACGVDLTAIDGIDTGTALKVLAEAGPDLSRFKSAKHFASWLGLCPRTKISCSPPWRHRHEKRSSTDQVLSSCLLREGTPRGHQRSDERMGPRSHAESHAYAEHLPFDPCFAVESTRNERGGTMTSLACLSPETVAVEGSKNTGAGSSTRGLTAPIEMATPDPSVGENVRIAVVDDDPAILRSLERLLRTHGYEAHTYASAPALLAEAAELRPSCIVVDLFMPGVGGLDVQRSLASAGLAFPLVFITGQGDIRSSVLAMRQGAIDFLPKPFTQEELLDAIARALERERSDRTANMQKAEFRQRAASLTRREHEVFASLVDGLMNKQVAAKLGIAEKTVKIHRARIMRKMQVRSTTQLARIAERFGIDGAARESGFPR